MNITQARDEMGRRAVQAAHELHGASLLMQNYPRSWPAELDAQWDRMVRRHERRSIAWLRLASAALRAAA